MQTTSDEPKVRLEPVGSVLDIRENIRRFQQGISEHAERALQLVIQTTYWVFDPESQSFGPAKFVGFQRMDFPSYIAADNNQATGSRFDGGVTHRAIAATAGEFRGSAQFTLQLKAWLDTTFGAEAVAGINPAKWKFVDLDTKVRYWALCCQPETYDGRRALEQLEELCWTLDRGDPQIGDKLVVWQSKGQRGRRGVIGMGEVIAPPGMREETQVEKQFWLKGTPFGAEYRTVFRVLHFGGLPLWESDYPDLLSNLSVAKARGGTVFNVTAAQWAQLVALAQARRNAEEETPGEAVYRGQGYGLSTAERNAVEMHAQKHAEAHYLSLGFEVRDVSRMASYDLYCVRGDETLHVEVKGTVGSGDSVLLTRNEVELAVRYPHRAVLYLVSDILLEPGEAGFRTTGGEPRILQPWDISKGVLVPTQYEYRLADENGR